MKATPKKVASRPRRMAKAGGRAAIEAWFEHPNSGMQPIARRLDRLIMEAMPKAVCAVKWGAPFYGLPGQGWIAAINSFKAHVKLLFFKGRALKPMLPTGKGHNAIDFHSLEELRLNEKQVKVWLNQAKKLPGWGLKSFPSKAA
jgi:hypothetical protein